jgi:hypothetical protein
MKWVRISIGCVLVTLSSAGAGCSSTDRESLDQRSFASCDGAGVDVGVRSLEHAARDVVAATQGLQLDVLMACAGIAHDLETPDTWSELSNPNLQLSNPDHGGACDQVSGRVRELLPESTSEAAPLISIGIARGECNLDFQRQLECDSACSTGICDSGAVTTRCAQPDLTALCHSSCRAEGACFGTLQNPTSCIGRCEADCVGNCHGTCFDSVTSEVSKDPAHCNGKCDSTCEGQCRGVCHVGTEDGIVCGDGVRCAGGCEGGFSEARCTTSFLAPACDVDRTCHESCSASVLAQTTCAPTTVLVSVKHSAPELATMVPTLKAHLPRLVEAAGRRGATLKESGERVLGAALELDRTTLNAGSTACLAQSIERVTWSLSDLNVAVTSSEEIAGSLQSRAH